MRGGLATPPGLSRAAWIVSSSDSKERSPSIGLRAGQINCHPRHPSRHASEPPVIELVRRIRRAVVVFVPEQGSVRHHRSGGKPKKARMVRVAKTAVDQMSGFFGRLFRHPDGADEVIGVTKAVGRNGAVLAIV